MASWVRVLMAAALSTLASACVVGDEFGDEDEGSSRFPVSSSYPPGTMERIRFTGDVPEGWEISALRTPERPDADWRIVIITGTPSWSEYWAPTIAGAGADREVIVADRPGFRTSEPHVAVRDLMKQVEALSPMLETHPGQRVVLVGQSFGAPIATLMAQRYPDRVHALVLVSAYFGDLGPTGRRMFGVGRWVRPLLARDLRNSVTEVSAQPRQLPAVWEALRGLQQPIVFIHGDNDTFVPLEADQRIAAEYGHTLIAVPGGDHFLNACCVPALLGAVEQAISEAEGRESAQPPVDQPADPDPSGGPVLRRQ